jgi:large subunit ribosomal protein L23
MIKPILTEKGLSEAKKGKYSFYVEHDLNKFQIKRLLLDIFGVHVTKVKTMNLKGIKKRDYKGKYRKIAGRKKAVVTLKGKETIDFFETKK